MANRRQPAVASGGGFMSSAISKPLSKETQELMKAMVSDSKLNAVQRRQLDQTIKAGKPLPRSCGAAGRHVAAAKPAASHHSAHKKKTTAASGIRSKETIASSGVFEADAAVPAAYSTPADPQKKERLQDEMTFGGASGKATRGVIRTPSPEAQLDRFDEVLQEIEERKSFLAEMDAVGRGGQYRTIITTEISLKIRELDEIDRKRSKALQERLRSAP